MLFCLLDLDSVYQYATLGARILLTRGLHTVDLTLVVSNILNTFFVQENMTDSPSPNCYRYKIAICK